MSGFVLHDKIFLILDVKQKKIADYQKSLRLKNTAKKALDILGKVKKVEKENWKPPDP